MRMVKSLGLIQWTAVDIFLDVSGCVLGKGKSATGKNNSLFVILLSLGNVEFDFSGKPDLICQAEGAEDA